MGVVAMAFPGLPEPWAVYLLRRAAAVAGWAAVAVYSLGLSGVLLSEHGFNNGADSIPARPAATASTRRRDRASPTTGPRTCRSASTASATTAPSTPVSPATCG
ncbi:hypothetical protein ACR6C2_40630 [Streptomyces sp. INA 01156]